jgi:dynein heavy chain
MSYYLQHFIAQHMGCSYVQPPSFDLLGCYNDSSCCSPLIFILSPGADPMAGLLKFAGDQGYKAIQLQAISLGQGQVRLSAKLCTTGYAVYGGKFG